MVRPSDRVFTISNALTLFRVFLTIPLIWMLETGQLPYAFGLIVVAVISDFLDGYLARHIHEVTNIGKMLDPIADKFILLGVMIFLIMDPERRFPLYFLLLRATKPWPQCAWSWCGGQPSTSPVTSPIFKSTTEPPTR